jgi:phage baseplate assembly protein V
VYRPGIVTQIDPEKCVARVRFPDRDDIESHWLAVVQHKTLRDKVYWMPDIDEHVACMMDARDEEGCILGAIYSEADTPPETNPDIRRDSYADGCEWMYDREAHLWKLIVPAAGTIRMELGQASLEITNDHVKIVEGAASIEMTNEFIKLIIGGTSIEMKESTLKLISPRIDWNP